MSAYTKIDANISEKANMIKMFVNYINTTHPGKNLSLSEPDIEFGNPANFGSDHSYWDSAFSASGVNNVMKPNTEVSVTISKADYKGIVPAKLFYHRHDLKKILGKMFADEKEFVNNTSFDAAGITVDTSGVTAFTNYIKTKLPLLDESVTYNFYHDVGENAKYFTVKVKANSFLYIPESGFSIRATESDSLPWITDLKQ